MAAGSDAIEEIERLYYAATKQTIARDLERAVALLITVASEDERERAAVFMDGLSQMRSEWGNSQPAAQTRPSSTRPGSNKGRPMMKTRR